MLKESTSLLTGNDQYEGFAIDIIDEMSKILGFKYTFEIQTDNVYGSLNKTTGKWDGMIARIMSGVSQYYKIFFAISSHTNVTNPLMNSIDLVRFANSAATFHRMFDAKETLFWLLTSSKAVASIVSRV